MLEKSAYLSVLLVAGLHIIFMIIELIFWDTDFGRRLTRLSPTASREAANIGLNPALYNGFLGFGLFWATFALNGLDSYSLCPAGFSCVHCWDGCRGSNLG